MADFFELLKTRRSIRNFEDKSVPLETIREIITDACLAPSSGNGQPWKFIIITDKDTIKSISDESKKNILDIIEKNPGIDLEKYRGAMKSKDFNVFYNAPALVIIVGPKATRSTAFDCSLAACYFMLSAAARGLGTCWVNLGSDIRDPALLEKIGMPSDCVIVAPIILGYPKGIPGIPHRNEPAILKIVS